MDATLLVTPLIDFLTGKIIEAGTGGDVGKQGLRATELLAINTALAQVNNGDPAGLPGLQAAIVTTNLTPGEALAVQSVFVSLGKLTALAAGQTLLGAATTAIANAVLSTANSVCNVYIAKAKTAVPAGSGQSLPAR